MTPEIHDPVHAGDGSVGCELGGIVLTVGAGVRVGRVEAIRRGAISIHVDVPVGPKAIVVLSTAKRPSLFMSP